MPMCYREEWDCPVEGLKNRIAQLEKEADWLAMYAARDMLCIKPNFDCKSAGQMNQCHICLRDFAREAVRND